MAIRDVISIFTFRKLVFFMVIMGTFITISPSLGQAQTIGVVVTRNREFHEKALESFLSTLEEGGYYKLNFITQRPLPDPIALRNAARKLIAADVDAIVTFGAPATFAALRERPGIPVVYVAVDKHIASRIKAKNFTGVCSELPVSSLMRYLNSSSTEKRLGVLYCSLEEDSITQLKKINYLARKYGLSVIPLNLRKSADISTLLSTLDEEMLIITSSSVINNVLPTVLRIAGNKKMLTASLIYRSDENATIMLHADPAEHGREAARRLMKLLKGISARDIPPVCSKEIEIVFNLREAQELGIRISMDLVTEATKLIY